MDPAQWGRFTDFGVPVRLAGPAARQATDELCVRRLQVELPEGHGDMPVTLGLFPGFADSAGGQRWSCRASVRVYADTSVVLARSDSGATTIAPRASATGTFSLPDTPWPLGAGSFRWACWWHGRTVAVGPGRSSSRVRRRSSHDTPERSHRPDRRGAGVLGRLARSAGPAGARRPDRLPDDGLPRRSHHVHHAEAEVARPDAGYARDFVPLMERILPDIVERRASGSRPTPAA